MQEKKVDVAVLGAGPGGYVSAIRLGQKGLSTMIVDKAFIGGTCLNTGCIPSKSLIHAASFVSVPTHAKSIGITFDTPTIDMKSIQTWKQGIVSRLTKGVEGLLKGNHVDVVNGHASFISSDTDHHELLVDETTKIIAKHVVIATGSTARTLPEFPVDQTTILDSTGLLNLETIPQSLIILGGGYIGLELGIVYAKLGTAVTIVETMPRLLSAMDPDTVAVVSKTLRRLGVVVHCNTVVKNHTKHSTSISLEIQTDQKNQTIEAEKLFVSIGRKPNTEGLGLDKIDLNTDEHGFIPVNETLQTNKPGVYAIGDVTSGPMLAHRASNQGEIVADVICGDTSAIDPRVIPAVVFTDPEISSVGMTESELKEAGCSVLVGKFPFAASGRAMSVNNTDGFVKVIADSETKAILGVHIVGAHASEMIAEAGLVIEMGATLEDIVGTVHAHPSLSEAFVEAAHVALGQALHIMAK